jgi:DNA-binding Lrp family transcriptional regulator
MDELLNLLREDASLTPAEIANRLNQTEADVEAKIKEHETNGVILGYRTVLNEEKLDLEIVRAVIEVKITPEREGGFDRVALRISQFNEVASCYLMSGAYDLLVIVEGRDLRAVSTFVAEKLATMPGVISTATHFILKPYKEHGVMMGGEYSDEKLAVAP